MTPRPLDAVPAEDDMNGVILGVDLDDLAAVHSWLTVQAWVAAGKIAVFGASHSGFAALSAMTRLPDRWAATVSSTSCRTS
jgi:dipeptidyl aminopeptidase/acylaminoacyl peptidase